MGDDAFGINRAMVDKIVAEVKESSTWACRSAS
jgi:hypothetical protein